MSAFAATRQRLVARGMICGATGRLTDAGLAYSANIMRDLRRTEAADGPGRSIRWNTKRKGHR